MSEEQSGSLLFRCLWPLADALIVKPIVTQLSAHIDQAQLAVVNLVTVLHNNTQLEIRKIMSQQLSDEQRLQAIDAKLDGIKEKVTATLEELRTAKQNNPALADELSSIEQKVGGIGADLGMTTPAVIEATSQLAVAEDTSSEEVSESGAADTTAASSTGSE